MENISLEREKYRMLRPVFEQWLEVFRTHSTTKLPSETLPRIHVDEIAVKIAALYEQLRNVLDYREEHVLRKQYILRSLQRHLYLGESRDRRIAESLVREIIRAGHLPNDTIPEERINDVIPLINNLLYFLEEIKRNHWEGALSDWLIRVTSCAVEETLAPPVKDRLTAELMHSTLMERAIITGADVSELDKRVQLFIAIQRSLLKVDDDQLSYRLLLYLYPYWNTPTLRQRETIARDLPILHHSLSLFSRDPLRTHFTKLCARLSALFLIIADIVFTDNPTPKLFEDTNAIQTRIEAAYKKRLVLHEQRLRRLAVFSVLSVFITKVLIAMAIEIPIDVWRGDFSPLATILNIIVPPLLLVLILAFLRRPTHRSLEHLQRETAGVVYRENTKEYLIAIPPEKSRKTKYLVRFLYALLTIAIVLGVLRVLTELMSIPSATVFLLFTSIVAATGTRIHNRWNELKIEGEKASFLWYLLDLIAVPFVGVGTLAMSGLSRIRIFVIIANIIDAPFHLFLTFLENFNAFLRAKKDEVD